MEKQLNEDENEEKIKLVNTTQYTGPKMGTHTLHDNR